MRRRVVRWLVRIERGIVGKRQYLAGRWIHDHDAPTSGFERANAEGELSFCDVLNGLVDGEDDVLSLHRAIVFHLVRKNDVPAPVTNRLDAANIAPELFFVCELDALDAAPVDVGKPEQVRREVTVRVVPPRFDC